MEKKRATPKVMRLVDGSTGKMECRICGSIHYMKKPLALRQQGI